MEDLSESTYSNNVENLNIDDSIPCNIVSDYVNNLVEPICKEFQSIISLHGDEILKNLMPMVGSCLDTLNRIYSEKHNLEVEFELLKEDSSQLMTQYEREKHLRRKTDESLFRAEDALSEKISEYDERIQQLESQIKMSEIRSKNLQDHIARLEEREVDRKKETDRLYIRYQDLMKNHMDIIEKSRNYQREMSINVRKSSDYQNESLGFINENPDIDYLNSNRNISENSLPYFDHYSKMDEKFIISDTSSEDIKINDIDDLSGNPSTPFTDDLVGMTQEIECIIKENTELTATKNALNIVKDDLITKLDEANSEIEILQHETETLNSYKVSLKIRLNELESENKALKQDIVQLQRKLECNNEDENVPISQRKRFTRLEMARILMERNQYKEKFNELEEYFKWVKLMNSKERKLSIWERFQRIFKPQKEEIKYIYNSNEQRKIREKIITTSPTSDCQALNDSNRYQACGWSLPNKNVDTNTLSIPMPIYCRPLHENQQDLKANGLFEITCATTIDIISGKSKDGDTYIGDSVFYDSQYVTEHKSIDEIQLEDKLRQAQLVNKYGKINVVETEDNNIFESHIWIVTTSLNQSQVIIIDANKPAQSLDTFLIPDSVVLCITSVPGAKEKDYLKDIHKNDNLAKSNDMENFKFKISTVNCIVKNENNSNQDEGIENTTNDYSTIQSTVWIGCRDGNLFIHPVLNNKSHCLKHVKLPDAITHILYQNTRVFISLANGDIVIISRFDSESNFFGQWNVSEYILLQFEKITSSIRTMESVTLNNSLWCAYKNLIIVINDVTLKPIIQFEAHPKHEYYVKQMCWAGDGVWISLRLDAILRLFHAFTYQHLQDINIEPHVNKLIEPSLLGLSLLRITCIAAVNNCLWIGINNGIVICAPFLKETHEFNYKTIGTFMENTEALKPNDDCYATFIPFLNTEDLQLSYHGHTESVKFFVSIYRNYQKVENNNLKFKKLLVISGGEGYKDFRLKENNPSLNNISKNESFAQSSSHLIVWQL